MVVLRAYVKEDYETVVQILASRGVAAPLSDYLPPNGVLAIMDARIVGCMFCYYPVGAKVAFPHWFSVVPGLCSTDFRAIAGAMLEFTEDCAKSSGYDTLLTEFSIPEVARFARTFGWQIEEPASKITGFKKL